MVYILQVQKFKKTLFRKCMNFVEKILWSLFGVTYGVNGIVIKDVLYE